MNRLCSLLTLITALGGCGVNDCSTVCQRHRGFWLAQTGCADPGLVALRWEVALGADRGQCDVATTWCDRAEPRLQRGVRDCASQLSYVQLGGATCSLKIDDTGVSAICRLNGQTCDFAFVPAAAPTLSCAPARDGGADAAPTPDAAATDTFIDALPPSG